MNSAVPAIFSFNPQQATFLDPASKILALHGGPDVAGTRFSSYRHSVHPEASERAKDAFNALHCILNDSPVFECVLQPDSALLIDNCKAVHGREIVKSNSRLLIRLFGYGANVTPITKSADPLIVRG